MKTRHILVLFVLIQLSLCGWGSDISTAKALSQFNRQMDNPD